MVSWAITATQSPWATREGSVGDQDAGRGGDDFDGRTVGVFEVENAAEELAGEDGFSEIGDGFEEAGDGGETVVVAMEGLDPAGGFCALGNGAGEEPEVAEDVREAGLGEAVDTSGDGFAAAEFGGDNELALALGFRGGGRSRRRRYRESRTP